MKTTISFIIYCLAFFTIYNTSSFAQTIIDYQTWTGASGCNIFSSLTNVPATINGTPGNIAHQTVIGQPTFSQDAVNLQSRVTGSGSQNEGTEY
jgi:hypothetical protein